MIRARLVALLLGLMFIGGGIRPGAHVYWFYPQAPALRAPTAVERGRADAFARAARAGLGQWTDQAAATAAGYEPQSQGAVVHFVDPARLLAPGQAPDPKSPSALVFASGRLAGAMWMMAAAGVPGDDFGGPLTPWHSHASCRSGRTERPVAAGVACTDGEVLESSPQMLHVWSTGDAFAADMTAPALVCVVGRTG